MRRSHRSPNRAQVTRNDGYERGAETAMNHPEELLAPFVDGTATLQERAEVESHLTFCQTCREEIELARSAVAALSALPELEPPSLDLPFLATGLPPGSAESRGETA